MRYDIRYRPGLGFVLVGLIAGEVLSIPAFPGAAGFGSDTPGGRGGQVIAVTTLADSGPGSLREAVTTKGPRTIVFRVGGEIRLKSHLRITEPFITIAGQTAPGDGILLRDAGLYVQTHDVVIRYIRSRVGDSLVEEFDTQDSLQISDDDPNDDNDVYNIVVDHCSFSWSIDECVGIRVPAHDVTFSWNIVSEALRQPFTAEQIGKERSHSMSLILSGGPTRCSLHHNLLALCNSRNPRIQGGRHDFVNNVVYGWGWLTGTFSRDPEVNFVGNYYKPGPASMDLKAICEKAGDLGRIYVKGNRSPQRPGDWLPEWLPIVDAPTSDHRADEPFEVPPVTVTSADEAYHAVLRGAGATLPRRDPVDRRVVRNARLGMGVKIDRPADVGGYPEMETGEVLPDRDGDGMPDDWEIANGFDPDTRADGKRDVDGDGYTNLEEYLEYLVDRWRIPRPAVRTLSIDRKDDTPFEVHCGDAELPVIAVGNDGRTFYTHAYFLDEIELEVRSSKLNLVYASLDPPRYRDRFRITANGVAFRVVEEGPRVLRVGPEPDAPRLLLFMETFPEWGPSLDDENVIDPRDYGVLGRRANNTAKLQMALDDASKIPGGGIVFVTDGQHDIDTLRIPSNTTLYLGRSAVLHASGEHEPIVLFDGVENAALMGPGVIDGHGSDDERAVETVGIVNSRNIRIEDVVLRDPGDRSGMLLRNSDDIVLSRVKNLPARTGVAEQDGVSISSCHRVDCRRSFLSSNGHAVVIGTGENRKPPGCSEIRFYETALASSLAAIVIAVERSEPVRDVLIRDVDVVDATNGILIWKQGGASIEQIVFRDMTMRLRDELIGHFIGAPFAVIGNASGTADTLRDVLFDRVQTNAFHTSIVHGVGNAPVEDVKFWGVRIKAESEVPEGETGARPLFRFEHVKSPQMRFIYVDWPEDGGGNWGAVYETENVEDMKAPPEEIFETGR